MEEDSVSLEIERLFNEDQADRKTETIDWTVVGPRDKERATRIKQLYDSGLITTPQNEWHAAFIFQHCGGEQVGSEAAIEYLKMANELARRAMLKGYEPAKWIFAASEDRLLVQQGKLQKYGTQYERNAEGVFDLSPFEPSTTDEERAKFNVPSLAEAKKKGIEKTEKWNKIFKV